MVNPLVEHLQADLLQLAAPPVAWPGLRVVAAGVEGATELLPMRAVQFRKRCLRPVPADAGELLWPATQMAPALDYRTAFDLAPIGLVLSRERLIVDCNRQLLMMFGAAREALIGQSFELLYPTHEEFERTGERIAASLDREGWYADDRVMKRLSGDLFWCHVSGRALDMHHPHAAGIWSFEDLSARRKLKVEFTPREREIAALLVEGLTSKLIGRRLAISPRTVDVYRARLMRKLGAATTAELVHKLLGG